MGAYLFCVYEREYVRMLCACMSVSAYLLCTCALMHIEHQHYLLYIYECPTYLVDIYV